MIYKRVGDISHSFKKTVRPLNDVTYTLYSLPAFDDGRTPEVLPGSEIKSNKLEVMSNLILFNKLNPKYRRVWNVHTVNSPNSVCSTEFIPIVPNGINQNYLYYCLISDLVTKQVDAYRKGTSNSQQRIDEKILFSIEIPVPSVKEQERISDILASIDQKIDVNEKINDNLSKQAMAFYQDMFANRGFPVKPLDELFDISIGKTPPRKEFQWFSDTEGIKWASIANLGSCGTYIRETSERITEEAVKKFNIPVTAANTVLLSFKLTVGRVAITDEPMCTNEAIASFDEENHSLTFYLYCFLKEFKFQTLGSTSSIATAVNSKIIKKIPLPVPPQSELEMFNALVTPIFEQIRDLERENKHLSDMRDILLPKLLKGEL